MTYYIDAWLDHVPGGIEVLPGAIKWVIDGNWKIAAEQFAGDGYHAPVTHASSFGLIGDGFLSTQPPGLQFSSRLGHGYSPVPGRPTRYGHDPPPDYNPKRAPADRDRLG